ncbi:MAG: helix-turn-helix domain-containing protein [bacterium]|nr:helix-turn-helix domain-containing protein [bacterium]
MSTTMLTLDSLFTLREAASLLGVSSSTLRRWAKQGSIPYVRISTRGDIRIPSAALRQFIDDRLSSRHQ